ncbi:unnamed protein product [Ophioblennius macclurei]
MAATRVWWRPTIAVIITVLQIQALISTNTTAISVSAGQSDFIKVITLNVSRAREEVTPVMNSLDLDKINFPLYLTAMMSITAMLFVCVFTTGLLVAVKNKRSASRRNTQQSSSDYEPMMPRVIAEPQHRCQCSDPNCTELSTLPPSPGDSPSLASKQRESHSSLALSDYAEMDSPTLSFTRQYEHLDPNSLENHVYHSLRGNGEPKRGPSKETAGKRRDSV